MALTVRFKPKFPARVVGGTAISVTKTGGVYTFDWDLSALTSLPSVEASDRDNVFVPVYNSDTSTAGRVTFDVLLATIVAGFDATLGAMAGLTPTANQAIYFSGTDTAAVYSLTVGGRALAGTTAATDTLPYYDSATSAATTALSADSRTLLGQTSFANWRSTLGLAIGTNVQAYDATLQSIASLGTAADKYLYTTGVDTWAEGAISSDSRTLLAQTSFINWRSTLGLAIGSNVQAYDADLDALAALGSTGIAVRTAANTWAQRTLTGTANEISIANGSGAGGDPTISLPSALTFTGKTITGGAYNSLTGLSIRSTGSAFDLFFATANVMTANKTITWATSNSDRTITLSGNPTLDDWFNQGVKTTSAPTFAGATLTSPLVLSSGNIDFPATQVPSASANTLDDYEEGTWTPVLTFSTPGNLSVSYSGQSGTYTKIGRVVVLTGSITTSAFTHTTASGDLTITGIPFTPGADASGQGVAWQGITKAGYTQVVSNFGSANTFINFFASGSGVNRSNVAAADMPTGGTVRLAFTGTYHV